MADVDVLVIGAGPVGLTAAIELRRRGIDCRVVDRLPERLPFAKAVGIQPRTLEIWQSMGLVREALDAAAPLHGQLVYVNGEQVARITLELLLYADAEEAADGRLLACARQAREEMRGRLRVYAVLAPGVLTDGGGELPPTVHDGEGAFRQRYDARGAEGFLVRPDGYLGLRFDLKDPGQLSGHLRTVLGG